MKNPIFLLFALAPIASAQLAITEVMAKSVHIETPDNGDWWELTNTGSKAVNLSGYTWDDTPELPETISIFPDFTIKAGESVVILQEDAVNAALWKNAWGLSGTRVIDRDQFSAMGGEGFSNLSADGDEINLYDPSGERVAHVEVVVSIPGRSQTFYPDGTPIYGTYSQAGEHGAVRSKRIPGDVASPGNAGLHFTSFPLKHARGGYSYRLQAANPGGAVPVLSAASLPPFLRLGGSSGGGATLLHTRRLTLDDAGTYLIEVAAESGASRTIQKFPLTVYNPTPSVILNEYNAVAAGNFLNGGTAVVDDDGGELSSDEYFGRVQGNGGRWAEFVVLGEGGVDPVDMRGWSIEIGYGLDGSFVARNTLVISDDLRWQAMETGTILTFIDRNTAQGGVDTGFALRDRRATVGDVWTNIWMGDLDLLDYTSQGVNGYSVFSGVVSGIEIDHQGTQFQVKDASGRIVFGPVGEGISSASGTSNKEVYELEGHPTPSVAPFVASNAQRRGYDDGASNSTFGYPNSWLDGETQVTQWMGLLTAPEIAIEQPVGVDLSLGASIRYPQTPTGFRAARTFTVRNVGTADLGGLNLFLSGANAADFVIINRPTASIPGPAGTTTFTVAFAPKSAGVKSAFLQITNDDDDEAPFGVYLAGTGYRGLPEISIQQPVKRELVDGRGRKNFGKVKVRRSSKAMVFTIRNTGKGTLSGLSIKKIGAGAKDYLVSAPARKALAPGASTTFKVRFKPRVIGNRVARIQIRSNDANENPFDIKLIGKGKK